MAPISRSTMSDTSRTISIARMGIVSILTLSAVVLMALILRIEGDELVAVTETIGILAMSLATVATGGGLAHGARHFGAKEAGGKK